MPDNQDTERTAVKTYIPAYQKDAWQEHAEQLNMSQSEFVRTMVQAGRRGFLNEPESSTSDASDAHQDGDGGWIRDRILEGLSGGPIEDDVLFDALQEEVLERADEVLADLQQQNEVRYSGRRGVYEPLDK